MPLLKVNQIASYSGNTLTIGTTGDTVTLAAGSTSSGFGATYNSGLNWTSTLVTSSLTVSAGVGYFVNTSTAAITLTLPSSPTFGSIIGINDYSGYASTNNITINPNGNKLEGVTLNKKIITDKESVILNYVDSTRGWLPTSGVNNGTDALSTPSYSIDFLVVAGGGGGGGEYHGGAGGAGGFRTSTQTATGGTVITVTVGDGGAGGISAGGGSTRGSSGIASSISGSGLTTITSAGGGGGGVDVGVQLAGLSGGSGGGGTASGSGTGGSGNTPSVSPSQGNNGGAGSISAPNYGGGGGGGASAVGGAGSGSAGGNGGAGTASSITGSSVTYAGGGGGSSYNGGTRGSGGSGGGGTGGGGSPSTAATSGTANLGGGGGGGERTSPTSNGGSGGKGVVILSMPDASYSGTTTGSPTVSTNVSGKTVLKFNGDGSYTA